MIQTIYVRARRPGRRGSQRAAPPRDPSNAAPRGKQRRRRRGISISSWTSVSPTLRILTLSTHPSSSSPHSLSFPSSIHISLAMRLSVSSCPFGSALAPSLSPSPVLTIHPILMCSYGSFPLFARESPPLSLSPSPPPPPLLSLSLSLSLSPLSFRNVLCVSNDPSPSLTLQIF